MHTQMKQSVLGSESFIFRSMTDLDNSPILRVEICSRSRDAVLGSLVKQEFVGRIKDDGNVRYNASNVI